ncbi:DUF4430 domain-containing protein [Romboutsia weinsteinii]|uniref:DUF4430 domain-containing protein n=1 Tax=Romboutsia weinsteinii TaxID=2020949 RepID=A0A371J5B1_9FIRM|nr:DUF4430 domain-containing protein [Romboutsia weinsteinii]RDY27867.1 DUF4430 domain-containing protein [Romboutsia weinsteinii]
MRKISINKIAILLLVLLTFVSSMTGCSSDKSEGNLAVKVTIIGPNKEDYILKDYEIYVKEGTSSYEGLAIACKENKIQISAKGTGKSVYVDGINNLYEFDEGAESGWLYRVNDEFPDKSSGATVLEDGDKLDWLYTKDLGKDWGSKK